MLMSHFSPRWLSSRIFAEAPMFAPRAQSDMLLMPERRETPDTSTIWSARYANAGKSSCAAMLS